MIYEFSPDLDKLFREQMTAGNYRSADDLLRDALQALHEQRNSVLEEDPEVVEGIRRGLDDIKAGRFQSFSEFDAEFRAKRNP